MHLSPLIMKSYLLNWEHVVGGICLRRLESYSEEQRQCGQVNDVVPDFWYLLVAVP